MLRTFHPLKVLLVHYRQACCTIIENTSPVTVITRTIHTSVFYDCWARFAHLRLLLVQYTQACCRIVEHASHTYGHHSYNTYKRVVQLLRTLCTLTVVTRTIHTSLLSDCLGRFAHLRLLLVQYTQVCCPIV